MTTNPLPNYDEWIERPYYQDPPKETDLYERSDEEYERYRDEGDDERHDEQPPN
jgi:hypothetical protein